jgi:hypothetical protein
VKAIVVHDKDGRIMSFTIPKSSLGVGIGVQLAPGEAQVELDFPDDLDTSSLLNLHEQYCVDVQHKKLISKQ